MLFSFTNVVLYTGMVKMTSFLFCFLSRVVFCFNIAWNWNLDADISSWWYFWQEDNIGWETDEETAAKNRPTITKKKVMPSRFSPRLQEYRIMYPVLHFSTVWPQFAYYTLHYVHVRFLDYTSWENWLQKALTPIVRPSLTNLRQCLLKKTLSCLPGAATQRFARDGTGLWP